MSNELSKFLSYLLRHRPEAKNIILDKEGWASIDELSARARSAERTGIAPIRHSSIDMITPVAWPPPHR